MRSIEETEEQEHTDTEITLGMKSLLGVFFGLVLICGVFFGFGYSLGRGSSSSPRPVSAPNSASTVQSAKTTARPPLTSTAEDDDGANPATYTPGPDASES